MQSVRPVVVDYGMITAFGKGVDPCWEGLRAGQTAIKKINRFNTDNFQSKFAATIKNLKANSDESLIMQMLKSILKSKIIAKNSLLILATTTGEIGILEQALLKKEGDYKKSNLSCLAAKVKNLVGLNSVITISGACSSSNIALGQAASLITSGSYDSVVVVACDSVSEFIFSGFSSLMALDKNKARPFDENRSGLTIGEAAGFIVLMSQKRAKQEKKEILAKLIGWGASNDANHMTGPSRNGEGLALAISKAIKCAGVAKEDIGSISAHGTGTIYNDSMEIKAFKSIFLNNLPVYSIKGAIGHTMGACGLIEAIIAIESLRNKIIPPTVGLFKPDQEAQGWVSDKLKENDKNLCLSVNSGFGGINAAILLQR